MSDPFPTAGRSDGGGSVQGEGGAALGPDRGDGGRAREHGGLLEVSWTAPASAQSITGYEVKYWKAADPEGESFRTHLTGSTDKSMLLYPFLDANTEYKLRVRARNAIGGGAWSEVARERTGAEQPGKPIMSLQVVDGNGSDIDTITAGGTFRYRVKLTNIRNHHFTSDGGSDPGYDPDDHGWGTFGIRGHHAMNYNYDNGASLSCEGGALLLRGALLLSAFVETFATSGYWEFVSPVIPADASGAPYRPRGSAALGAVPCRVRAKHNRVLADGGKLFDTIRAAPPRTHLDIKVDRASARRAARAQKAFAGREARMARVALHWREIALPVPKAQRKRLGPDPVRLSLVHVCEEEAPLKGAERLQWLLITTLPVASNDQAQEILELYGLRWRIKDYHRILKSGCDVEKIAHTRVERIKRTVTINAVIAWRLATLTLMGRETPELLAETMFSKIEIAILRDFAIERRIEPPPGDGAAAPPMSLGGAILLIARLGGYLNRKSDAPPGHQVIWEGYTPPAAVAQAMERAVKIGDKNNLYSIISSVKAD